MPERIKTYLRQMDTIREDSNKAVDEILKSLNVSVLLTNPSQALKAVMSELLKNKYKDLTLRAASEGEKLAKTL